MSKLENFIAKANQKYQNKYNYSKSIFKNVDTNLIIICPIHGEFQQTPHNHITSTHGCKKCGEAAAAASKRKSIDHFIAKAKFIHGDKYIYTKSIYTSAKEKITITCPHHGDFEQLVSGHLSGYGCKHCASHGKGRVDMNKPCTLYYLHLKGIDYYKIGITSLSIEHRYRTTFDKEQFDIVFTKQFSTGREAYNTEQELLSKYTHLIHTGPKLLKTGNTEIFTEDIFKGDYSEYTN